MLPKRIEESTYKNVYLHKLELVSGNFYIFDTFVVGEINEGVHFNWQIAEGVIEKVYEYFGTRDIKVSYISNRVNDYSVHAQDWIQFYKERHHLESFAIVAYSKIGLMNVILEKIFSQTRIKKFENLDKAIEWVSHLNPSDDQSTNNKS